MTSNSQFIVINCENSKAWNPINFGHMFINQLQQKDDLWSSVNVALGESLPDDILEYRGIVITGSHFNIRDQPTLPWFDSVSDFIRSAAINGKPNIYGGCFGCQIIAHSLGGMVDYNPEKKFILKSESVQLLEPAFFQSLQLDQPFTKKSLTLIESHGDCVHKLPVDAIRLATSESCTNEIYVCGNKQNILACQSHPEFEYKYCIEDRIWKAVVETNHRLKDDEIPLASESFQKHTPDDSLLFLQMISRFLHKNSD